MKTKKEKIIRLTESQLHNIVKNTVKSVLKESGSTDVDNHWNNMIRLFLRRLKEGKGEIGDRCVYVNCADAREIRDGYSREVIYSFNSNRLRDDDCYVQHSRPLTQRELNRLYDILENVYNVNMDEYRY